MVEIQVSNITCYSGSKRRVHVRIPLSDGRFANVDIDYDNLLAARAVGKIEMALNTAINDLKSLGCSLSAEQIAQAIFDAHN